MSGLSGRTLTTAATVFFGLALFGVLLSIHPLAGFNTKGIAEQHIPVFEMGDEEPTANRSEDDTPKPVLLPASTETPPSESIEMATDPQASEAVEFVLQKPSAEVASRPADPIVTAAKSWSYKSASSENMPALSQEYPAQPPEDPYVDETLLPMPPQTALFDMPTGMEEMSSVQSPQQLPDLVTDSGTSAQPLPSDLPADVRTPPQPPPAPSDETVSSPDLPADTSPLAEDTAYLE